MKNNRKHSEERIKSKMFNQIRPITGKNPG